MTNEKKRFFDLLNKCQLDIVREQFNQSTEEMNVSGAESVLTNGSSGERLMMAFFAGVWTHSGDKYPLNIFDAVCSLDGQNRVIITDYLRHPFHP